MQHISRQIQDWRRITRFLLFAGEQERHVKVSKEDPKAVITDFDSRKEYSFKVYTVSGSQMSKPLLGTYKGNQCVQCINVIFIWQCDLNLFVIIYGLLFSIIRTAVYVFLISRACCSLLNVFCATLPANVRLQSKFI